VRTLAEVGGKIAEGQAITIAAEMNNLIYKEKFSAGNPDNAKLTDYTTVDLNPHYTLTDDSWMIRIGANMDFSLGYGKRVQFSPDVNINYIFADSYIAYINATGGRRLNDFRQAEVENPYSIITGNLVDGYEQANIDLGVKGSPAIGLHFNIHAGYQLLRNDIYSSEFALISLPPTALPITFLYGKTNNTFAGLDLSYDYRSKVSLSLSALYRHWDISDKKSTSTRALLFHPELALNAAVTARPIDKLMVELSYQYERRAKVEGSTNMRPAPVSDLRLHGEYNFYKTLSVYANVNNILNKSYQHYYFQPTEGFNLLGGLIFKF
jgi:outer membrane receptor protein involved in Fe transport